MSDTIVRAYRTQLDPTVAQRRALAQQAGAARWVYNWALGEWERREHAGERASWMDIHQELTRRKAQPELAWLREISSYVIREAVHDLGNAFTNYSRRLAGRPTPRRAYEPSGRGFRIAQPKKIDVAADAVLIPRVGWIKLKERGYIPLGADYRGVACRERAGRWYVAVQVEEVRPATRTVQTDRQVGVELGRGPAAVTSDERRYQAGPTAEELEGRRRKLALWQRRMARRFQPDKPRKEQSAGWHEAAAEVAAINASLADLTRDRLHQASARVVRDAAAGTLVFRETHLRAKGGRSTATGVYELRRQIEYKQDWAGGRTKLVPAALPCTTTCNACGHVLKDQTNAGEFICTNSQCALRIDRQLNTSHNLRDFHGKAAKISGGGARRRKTPKGAQWPVEPEIPQRGGNLLGAEPDGDAKSAPGAGNRAASEEFGASKREG